MALGSSSAAAQPSAVCTVSASRGSHSFPPQGIQQASCQTTLTPPNSSGQMSSDEFTHTLEARAKKWPQKEVPRPQRVIFMRLGWPRTKEHQWTTTVYERQINLLGASLKWDISLQRKVTPAETSLCFSSYQANNEEQLSSAEGTTSPSPLRENKILGYKIHRWTL